MIGFLDYLRPKFAHLNAVASSWEGAVRLAGEILIKQEIVQKSYVEAMIEAINELGPYCVIAPGVAMPHARPENGVLQPGFSLVTLRDPVWFGSEQNDPVDIIIGFAAVDKKSHVKALQQIAHYLRDQQFVEELRSAKTSNELVAAVQKEG